MPTRSTTFDSNGPEGRIRGNAAQVYERYLALARDAASSGDRVLAESFQQYAEHYYRVMNDSTDPQPLRPQNMEPREGGDGEEMQGRGWNSEARGEGLPMRQERPRYEPSRGGGIGEPGPRNGEDGSYPRDRRAEGLSFESGDQRDQPSSRTEPTQREQRSREDYPREERPREERPREERPREDRPREDRPRGFRSGPRPGRENGEREEEPEDAGLRKMLGERPSRVEELALTSQESDTAEETPRPRRRRRRPEEPNGGSEGPEGSEEG